MSDELLPSRRNSLRLQDFDYSAQCCYFITIVTQGRVCRFGDVRDGELVLNASGRMVEDAYQQMLLAFPGLMDVAHVIMPNHVHILLYNGSESSLTDAIRWFKSKTTNEYINGVKEQGWTPFDVRLWQTRFYDVILRNNVAYQYVLNYIYNNPMRWVFDRLNESADLANADDVGKELRLMNW
ncbi:MAG: transposase [Prevotella sp.]|nr:transposase [Prevotella sp.]